MWFKNLQIYRLPAPWQIDLAKLDEQLARGTFARCASHEPMSRGWVPPRKDGALIYSSNRQWLLALAVVYLLSPIDLIPDFVPVLGQLDDLVVVGVLVWIAWKMIPDKVKRECEEACRP